MQLKYPMSSQQVKSHKKLNSKKQISWIVDFLFSINFDFLGQIKDINKICTKFYKSCICSLINTFFSIKIKIKTLILNGSQAASFITLVWTKNIVRILKIRRHIQYTGVLYKIWWTPILCNFGHVYKIKRGLPRILNIMFDNDESLFGKVLSMILLSCFFCFC